MENILGHVSLSLLKTSDQEKQTFSFLTSNQLKGGKFVQTFVLTLTRALKMLITCLLNDGTSFI